MKKVITLEGARILDICRDIEYLCEQIYLYFAELFSQDSEMADIWLKTANEEKNHALQFELAIKIRKEVLEGVSPDSWTVTTAYQFVRNALEGVKKNPPNKVDALRLATRLEQRLVLLHLHCVGEFNDKTIQEMFSAMMADDNRHVGRLEEALSAIRRKTSPAK